MKYKKVTELVPVKILVAQKGEEKIWIDCKLQCVFQKYDKRTDGETGYTVHCKLLDLWSQGENKRDATRMIKDAVGLLMWYDILEGILEPILKRKRFRVMPKKVKVPKKK